MEERLEMLFVEGAQSSKATERKKAAEEMKSLLAQEALLEFVDEQEDGEFGWNWIFTKVHEFLLNEVHKSKEGILEKNKRESYLELLRLVVSTAMSRSFCFQGSLFFEKLLEVLREDFFRKEYGEAYLHAAYPIASSRQSTSTLGYFKAAEVLRLCMSHFQKEAFKLPCAKLIRVLLVDSLPELQEKLFKGTMEKFRLPLEEFFHFVLEEAPKNSLPVEAVIEIFRALVHFCGWVLLESPDTLLSFLNKNQQESLHLLMKSYRSKEVRDICADLFRVLLIAAFPRHGHARGFPMMDCLQQLRLDLTFLSSYFKKPSGDFVAPVIADYSQYRLLALFAETVHHVEAEYCTNVAHSLVVSSASASSSKKPKLHHSIWVDILEELKGFSRSNADPLPLIVLLQTLVILLRKYPSHCPPFRSSAKLGASISFEELFSVLLDIFDRGGTLSTWAGRLLNSILLLAPVDSMTREPLVHLHDSLIAKIKLCKDFLTKEFFFEMLFTLNKFFVSLRPGFEVLMFADFKPRPSISAGSAQVRYLLSRLHLIDSSPGGMDSFLRDSLVNWVCSMFTPTSPCLHYDKMDPRLLASALSCLTSSRPSFLRTCPFAQFTHVYNPEPFTTDSVAFPFEAQLLEMENSLSFCLALNCAHLDHTQCSLVPDMPTSCTCFPVGEGSEEPSSSLELACAELCDGARLFVGQIDQCKLKRNVQLQEVTNLLSSSAAFVFIVFRFLTIFMSPNNLFSLDPTLDDNGDNSLSCLGSLFHLFLFGVRDLLKIAQGFPPTQFKQDQNLERLIKAMRSLSSCFVAKSPKDDSVSICERAVYARFANDFDHVIGGLIEFFRHVDASSEASQSSHSLSAQSDLDDEFSEPTGVSRSPQALSKFIASKFSLLPSKALDTLKSAILSVCHDHFDYRHQCSVGEADDFLDVPPEDPHCMTFYSSILSDPASPLCVVFQAAMYVVHQYDAISRCQPDMVVCVLRALIDGDNPLLDDPHFFEPEFKIGVFNLLSALAPNLANLTSEMLHLVSNILDKLRGSFMKPVKPTDAPLLGYLVGPEVRVAWLQCVASFIKVEFHQYDVAQSIKDDFLSLDLFVSSVRDRDLRVRLCAASLFDCLSASCFSDEFISLFFKRLEIALRVVLQPWSENEPEDSTTLSMDSPTPNDFRGYSERQYHVASAMLSLVEFARRFPFRENRIVFLLFREGLVDASLAPNIRVLISDLTLLLDRMMIFLAQDLKYKSVADFLDAHLSVLLSNWILTSKQNQPLSDFPLIVFRHSFHCVDGCSTSSALIQRKTCSRYYEHWQHFLERFQDEIFPRLIVCDAVFEESPRPKAIAEALNLELETLVRSHYGRIIGYLIPMRMDPATTENYRNFTNVVLPRLLKQSVPKLNEQIIREVLRVLLSNSYDGDSPRSVKAIDSSPTSVSYQVVLGSLKYLIVEKFRKPIPDYLFHNHVALDLLHQTCLQLSRRHRICDQEPLFHRFTFILDNLLNENQVLFQADDFYVRYVVYSLSRIIASSPRLRAAAVKKLAEFSTSLLALNSEALNEQFLSFVAVIIDCLAMCYPPETLNIFIDESGDVDPLRKIEALKCVSQDLRTQISDLIIAILKVPETDRMKSIFQFISPSVNSPVFSIFEVPRTVIQEIFSGETFVSTIVSFLHMRKFTPTASSSNFNTLAMLSTMLAQLQSSKMESEFWHDVPNFDEFISQVIGLCYSGSPEIQKVASACLSELGHIELSSSSVPPPVISSVASLSVSTRFFDQPLVGVTLLLDSCLCNLDMEIVDAASHAAMSLLRSNQVNFDQYKNTSYMDILTTSMRYMTPFGSFVNADSLLKKFCHVHDAILFGNDMKEPDPFSREFLWLPKDPVPYRLWLSRLMVSLLKYLQKIKLSKSCLIACLPLCYSVPEVCEEIFAFVIHELLLQKDSFVKQQLSSLFDLIFANSESPAKVVRLLISTIDFLRRCPYSNPDVRVSRSSAPVLTNRSTHWQNLQWLQLDYLKVAAAAFRCHSHFACLYYAEIWMYFEKERANTVQSSDESQPVEPPFFRESEYTRLVTLAADEVNEPDTFYGLEHASKESRLMNYSHERQWEYALGMLDLSCRRTESQNSSSGKNVLAMCAPLRALGYDHLLLNFVNGAQSNAHFSLEETASLDELRCEASWRNSLFEWQAPPSAVNSSSSVGFHRHLTEILSSMVRLDQADLNQALTDARAGLMVPKIEFLESAHSVSTLLARLRCLHEAEAFSSKLESYFSSSRRKRSLASTLGSQPREVVAVLSEIGESSSELARCLAAETHWLNHPSVDNSELILGFRQALLANLSRICQEHPGSEHAPVTLALKASLRAYASFCLEQKLFQQAFTATAALRQFSSGSDSDVMYAQIEESSLCWARGERRVALQSIKQSIKMIPNDMRANADPQMRLLKAKAYRLWGTFLGSSQAEDPVYIVEELLSPSLSELEALDHVDHVERMHAHRCLAAFAQTQYRELEFGSTPTEHSAMLQGMRDELELHKKHQEKDSDKMKSMHVKRKIKMLTNKIKLEEESLKEKEQNKGMFLQLALEHFLASLREGDAFDSDIFIVCSLWFQNSSIEDLSIKINDMLPLLASHKWVPLVYQLAARLSEREWNTAFQKVLVKLLIDLGSRHPYHTVNVLLALSKADHLKLHTDWSHVERDKANMAKRILESLRKTENKHFRLADLIKAVEHVSDSCISLSDVPVDAKKPGPFDIPAHTNLHLVEHSLAAVFTCIPAVDPSGQYDRVVRIARFKTVYTLVGGINSPKRITCLGENGVMYNQLLKGKDDLRQDAVMQQVFTTVNGWLQKDSATRRRSLHISTYAVVPLSQQAGVLEWRDDTTPLADYLVKQIPGQLTPAHERYFPQDMKSAECRDMLKAADGSVEKGHPNSLLSIYNYICSKFHPVFRHFFLERYIEPRIWFERRLSFTRSVAASSIVGYILGIGDRHPSNILIDTMSAEIVHIDFGVAFDQGKHLNTPETVPFRLTRDIVDGFGPQGVEGVFRVCCEAALTLLRKNEASLLTIVSVFLYDPLHNWKMSTAKANILQNEEEGEEKAEKQGVRRGISERLEAGLNVEATGVLLHMADKLQGKNGAAMLSVEGQVNFLIKEATSPENLCRVFPGWQPWI